MKLSHLRFTRPILLPGCVALFTLWLVGSAQTSKAQATLTTLMTNGPTASRINIVVLSEGYQTNQLGQFLADASTLVGGLLAIEPYSEYSNYFNAFAISVASVDSGADHPPGTLKNTYFSSTFNSYGLAQLLTIPPNNWNPDYSQGKGKVLNLLTNFLPDYNIAVILVNEPGQGGSGDAGLTNNPPVTVVTINSLSKHTLAHEIGHTLGGLADEYTNAYPGYVPVEKPNATTQTNRSLIKWRAWIDPSTPVPTPANDFNYLDSVGLFQGAQYQSSGWYRPQVYCKMNNLLNGFCAVCSEQLVRSIYTLVKPVQSILPAFTNLSIYDTQIVNFAVTPMQPSTHELTVAWLTNGVVVAGVTGSDFEIVPAEFGDGVHAVKAVVSDLTTLVRDDPFGVLTVTNTWIINVGLSQLTITGAEYLPANLFRFTVTGSAPAGFVIQTSSNLSTWSPLSTNGLVGGSYHFTNASSSIGGGRFYRTSSPP